MDRNLMLDRLRDPKKQWDFVVIGGGASGLGVALDAASRGYSTLLLEQGDFAQGTSSRSTKLIHGGLRYLSQGRVSLVREALQERAHLIRNAPHLVHPLAFLAPAHNWYQRFYSIVGVKLYEVLAEKHTFGTSSLLSNAEIQQQLPTLNVEKLKGGIRFYDGQFDDARLALNLAQTIVEQGGVALNYMRVQNLLKIQNRVRGVIAHDLEKDREYEIAAKVVVNATGVFTDAIRRMDDSSARESILPSQGIHIVLDRAFFPGEVALILPEAHGRVLFFIPWHQRVLVGTTDTPLSQIPLEPTPNRAEIEYLLEATSKYLTKSPGPSDIRSVFAGIRPLIKPRETWTNSASLSRQHILMISKSQLVTLVGGKWTTYRKMGEETVNAAIRVAQMDFRPSKTKKLRIHGWMEPLQQSSDWSYYGADAALIEQLSQNEPELKARLHPDLPYRKIDVVWAVRQEMARRVEDVLSRRSRALILGARESMEIAPAVAAIMAKELGCDSEWEKKQVEAYRQLAKGYLYSPL